MLLNYETVIVGDVCVLVPYRPIHVLKYHAWMQDPALLESTCSEPLSLDEEYDMQQSWRDDPSKCTFIVLSRELLLQQDSGQLQKDLDSLSSIESVDDFIQKTQHAMVGDVNMFVSDEEIDDENDDTIDDTKRECETKDESIVSSNTEASERRDTNTHRQAELDIMVAEHAHQKKGIGQEAATLMMLYGATNLNIRRIFCKINEDNVASLNLFQNKLKFVQYAYAQCFRQVELELRAESPLQLLQLLTNKSNDNGSPLTLQTMTFLGSNSAR